ncbi:MAG: AAA family ATPase [Actinobacteria bacterium]|nr:AAA family ATPase [Actinomycetota bacterium]
MVKEKKSSCRIISVVNQKGGVGKSTSAVNVSAYLGQSGFKTLLIDMDPQSNATSGLGIYPENIKKSSYDAIINFEIPAKTVLKTDYENLDIMPSSEKLSGAEVELVSNFKREYRLKDIIDQLSSEYDYILIDCSPALGLLTINALTASGEVLIPLQCEYYALEGIARLLKTVDLVKHNLNKSLEISGVVLTMYTRTRLSDQAVKEIRKYFPGKVFKTIIPRNVRLAEAPSFGEPILSYDPSCRGARAYESLTKELLDRHRYKLKERELKKEIEPLSKKIKVFWDTGAAPRHAASKKKQ